MPRKSHRVLYGFRSTGWSGRISHCSFKSHVCLPMSVLEAQRPGPFGAFCTCCGRVLTAIFLSCPTLHCCGKARHWHAVLCLKEPGPSCPLATDLRYLPSREDMTCPLLSTLHLAWATARVLSGKYEREIRDLSNWAICDKRPSLNWAGLEEAQVSY